MRHTAGHSSWKSHPDATSGTSWRLITRRCSPASIESSATAAPRPCGETLFTPKIPHSPSGLGAALDFSVELLRGTVLSIGLLPGRGEGLGWRGVDSSALGMLPGQQPLLQQTGIVKAGTDEARVGSTLVEAPVAQNHPSPEPALARYWPEVLAGFDELTGTLRRLDARGDLRALLEGFTGCRVRVVTRATEVYSELSRMLWHPVSLHKEAPARQRAHGLLTRMAANVSSAPGDPAVIHAEVEELLEGDIPVFTTLASQGRLEGPRGTHWLSPCNLVDAALEHWRTADFPLEKNVIQSALVSAYINDGWRPEEVPRRPERVRTDNLEARRRRIVAGIMRELSATAIRGKDGSVPRTGTRRGEVETSSSGRRRRAATSASAHSYGRACSWTTGGLIAAMA